MNIAAAVDAMLQTRRYLFGENMHSTNKLVTVSRFHGRFCRPTQKKNVCCSVEVVLYSVQQGAHSI